VGGGSPRARLVSERSPWRVLITPRAERDLERVPGAEHGRVVEAIDSLDSGLGHGDLRKLRGSDDEWRLRVGRWRIRFRPDFAEHVIVVLRVLPRPQAYRG